jgi:hypothetical protein
MVYLEVLISCPDKIIYYSQKLIGGLYGYVTRVSAGEQGTLKFSKSSTKEALLPPPTSGKGKGFLNFRYLFSLTARQVY